MVKNQGCASNRVIPFTARYIFAANSSDRPNPDHLICAKPHIDRNGAIHRNEVSEVCAVIGKILMRYKIFVK